MSCLDALRVRRAIYLASQLELEAHDIRRSVDIGQRSRSRHHLRTGGRVQVGRQVPSRAVRERLCKHLFQGIPILGTWKVLDKVAGL